MDLLLLPGILLMASLSLLFAFFLARLVSVAAAVPARSSSPGDDRPLLHAAAVYRAAAAGAGPEEAGEGELGEQREEKEPEEEQQERSSAAAALVPDSGLDDPRALDDGGRWREVEIVGARDEAVPTELPGISSDEAAGVLGPEGHGAEQGERKVVREIHLISAREDQEEDKPIPTLPTEEDGVGSEEQGKTKPTPPTEEGEEEEDEDDGVGTATTTAITTSPLGEEPPSDGEVRSSDPGPRAQAKTESSAVEVQQVKAVVPEEGGGSSSAAADDDDDDWEGIEASDLRKLFAVAASFVASPAGVEAISHLPADVQLRLHGLHKAATEGPCFEAQPMPLKIAARAKWHAWQKLGDMNPEVAMEQYITELSEKVPGWMVEKPNEQNMECEPNDSSEQHQLLIETESRKPEFN